MTVNTHWFLFCMLLLLGNVAAFIPRQQLPIRLSDAHTFPTTRTVTTPSTSTRLHFKRFLAKLFRRSKPVDHVHQALLGRRTVNDFATTPVDPAIVHRALEAAIHAPCHKMTEPWRFITLGPQSIDEIATLNAAAIAQKDPQKGAKKKARWQAIPGWCVVTSAKSDGGLQEREDYAATSCAIQNFMLSLWSQGVGTKWTSGPITRSTEFAQICGIDLEKEDVVGCIWYGYASHGLESIPAPQRRKSLESVSSQRP